ncbi:RNA polymerase sigma factor [Chitinophaga deserti]|uniref:RNA polymerase sigma factor n=1 Tax=Chitinophaga deserti TaxID=2164099 RepID=UPI0018E59AAD|nr:sigma-70 family RNA polymerase sigma factor [Chitinophaga deserti]
MSIYLVNHQYHNWSDREVADRVLEGEREAFSIIVERTEKLVIHIISGMVPLREDRQDIAQDVYLKAFRSLSGFRYEAKLSTWIARITYNTCVNHLRKKRLPLIAPATIEAADIPEAAGDPLTLLSARQLTFILQQAITRLSPLYNTLITLYHQANMSITEIAQITDLPEGTVKSYLYRARKLMQQHLTKHYQNKEAL